MEKDPSLLNHMDRLGALTRLYDHLSLGMHNCADNLVLINFESGKEDNCILNTGRIIH